MIVLEDNFSNKLQYKTYVALGSFDGLHIGHMGLINKTLELSKKNNVKSMIYTFKNHPLSVINKDKVPKLLMDSNTKLNLLEKLGIDIVNLVNFNTEYMKISPESFILSMIEYYNLAGIIVGFNYRFGYKNSGDVELLKKFSKEFNFELHVVDSVKSKTDNEIVSSSRIRNLILEGNILEANSLLIQPFMLKGEIIKGKQLGRTIGFPTANLNYDNNFVIPQRGVYYTLVKYKGKTYKGITSVGYNPTVEPIENKLSVETYILDFDEYIYGETINLYFIKRMRDEVKFDTLDELIEQLHKDKKFAEDELIENIS